MDLSQSAPPPSDISLPPDQIHDSSSHVLLRAYLGACCAFLIWGSSFAFGKFISPDPLSPINITVCRTLISALVLFLLIIGTKQIRPWIQVFKRNFKQYFLIGIFLYSCAFLIEYWALSHTVSSNQAILSNTMIYWVILINTIVYHSPPTKKFLIGVGLAIVGVILILLTDQLTFTSQTLLGDIGTILAYLFWGLYSAIMGKVNEKLPPLFSTFSIMLCASLFMIPLGLINGVIPILLDLSLFQWGVLMYLGIFAGAIAFFAYNWALSNKRVSSEYIAIFSLLNPVIGAILGFLFFQEDFSIRKIFGIVLILFAIVIANLSIKKKSPLVS